MEERIKKTVNAGKAERKITSGKGNEKENYKGTRGWIRLLQQVGKRKHLQELNNNEGYRKITG